ncbi:MAG: endolytic transglycosylase MltG [Acetanaerobacterium sp.]
MTPIDHEKEGYQELTLSEKLEKQANKAKPQLFDIEKSDEEFRGGRSGQLPPSPERPKAPPAAPSHPAAPQRPAVPQRPAESQRAIEPKKNAYRPNSFAELAPDVYDAPAKGTKQPNESARMIPKQEPGRGMTHPANDGVKIYGEKHASDGVQPDYTAMAQKIPARPAKPFKLNIADEDYNAIPDFDNRSRAAGPPPRAADSVHGRRPPVSGNAPPPRDSGILRKGEPPRSKEKFDYMPPNHNPGGGDSRPPAPRGNKTMRSLGRLANGIIYTVGVLFASILLSVFIIQSMSDVLGLFKSDREITIALPETANTQDVAAILKDNGVIAQPLTFRLYSKYRDYSDEYLNGSFTLNSKMSYDEIFDAIQVARDENQEVSITFIEGMTIREIAQSLEEQKVCSADEFITVLNTTDFGYEFEDLIPTGANRYLKLEGYLFPDTYTFYVGEKPSSVADKFLGNFNKKITADLIDRIEKKGMTLDDAIRLASIIQKEGRTLDDMYMVSSVFNNRLNKPETYPFLQSDVTINYVNNNITPYVTSEEDKLAYAEAYNTYKCEGLPIGPVSNPGINAIKAAIYPDESSYYYFLTDAEMQYYYAKTMAQHEANMAQAMQVGDEIGGVNTHTEE